MNFRFRNISMKLLAFLTIASILAFAPAAVAQDTSPATSAPAAPAAPAEPNDGSHVQFTGSFGNVAVVGLNVPIASRWSINVVNAFAPNDNAGLSFHTIELEYARNLSDLFAAKSAQFNPNRFIVAVSGGAGSVRNAQGSGNASFAFSAAARATLRLPGNIDLDLVNVRYWRSRIATVTGQANGDTQAGVGIRMSF